MTHYLAGGVDLLKERIVWRRIERWQNASAACKRQADNALRVDGLALFRHRQVVEIEKVLHSGRFKPTDVAPTGSGARNQGVDVTLAKMGNAFNSEPPIEQYRCRLGHEEQGGAPENQERQKSRRHPQSVP